MLNKKEWNIKNRDAVINNDNSIKLQVPGILQDYIGISKPQELRNQELFYRATGNIG
jgi:hypothetical protein